MLQNLLPNKWNLHGYVKYHCIPRKKLLKLTEASLSAGKRINSRFFEMLNLELDWRFSLFLIFGTSPYIEFPNFDIGGVFSSFWKILDYDWIRIPTVKLKIPGKSMENQDTELLSHSGRVRFLEKNSKFWKENGNRKP